MSGQNFSPNKTGTLVRGLAQFQRFLPVRRPAQPEHNQSSTEQLSVPVSFVILYPTGYVTHSSFPTEPSQ